MDFYKRTLELREETISHRRWLHRNAEVGLHMPKGQAYVMDQLKEYGLEPHPCGHGVTAELGQEGVGQFCSELIWMHFPCRRKAAKVFPVQPAQKLIPAATISMRLCC